MKKSLIALAVLAASGAAMAQSSVTLFGVVDATVRYVDADSGSQWSLTNSGYNSSRLGFRGTEDLGGGLNASFWLEAGVSNDTGSGQVTNANNTAASNNCTVTGATPATPGGTVTCSQSSGSQGLTFNRRSTVSLAGSWGELRLGRDYVPYFWNTTIFDPFGTNGVGSVSNFTLKGLSVISAANGGTPLNTTAAGVRASNSIGYFMPKISGFYGQAMYAMGEGVNTTVNNPNKSNGNVFSARLGYANGPFDIAVGYGGTTFAPSQQYEVWNVGGSWNFGAFKLMGLMNFESGEGKNQPAGQQDLDIKTYMIGASMPLGAGELKASYTYGDASYDLLEGSQIAIGYIYNLSKRTALYTTYSYLSNNSKLGQYNLGLATNAGGSTFGLDFGVKHSF